MPFDTTLLAGLIGGAFALAAAIFTAAFQLYHARQQSIVAERELRIAKKMQIVADLVAYRYVLTPGRASSGGVLAFNAALNRIPIEFIYSVSVIDKYRKIGDSFNSERFRELIIEMIREARPLPGHIDAHLFESVPSVTLPTPPA